MMCKNPYFQGVQEFGCGQCTPCGVNKQRTWVGRLLLELNEHPTASFVTLTYNDKNLPKDGCVSKKELQDWFKRLREKIEPRKIRYFAVGEYGEEKCRPHYHAIVFNLSPTEGDIVAETWNKGFVYMGTVQRESISYTASYIMKRWTTEVPALIGKTPEFAIMSRKPALGNGVVDKMISAYQTAPGKAALEKVKWMSENFHMSGYYYQLPRVIKEKVAFGLNLTTAQKRAYIKIRIDEHAQRRANLNKKEYLAKRRSHVSQQNGKLKQQRKSL